MDHNKLTLSTATKTCMQCVGKGEWLLHFLLFLKSQSLLGKVETVSLYYTVKRQVCTNFISTMFGATVMHQTNN